MKKGYYNKSPKSRIETFQHGIEDELTEYLPDSETDYVVPRKAYVQHNCYTTKYTKPGKTGLTGRGDE